MRPLPTKKAARQTPAQRRRRYQLDKPPTPRLLKEARKELSLKHEQRCLRATITRLEATRRHAYRRLSKVLSELEMIDSLVSLAQAEREHLLQ